MADTSPHADGNFPSGAKPTEGWVFLLNATKPHYVREARSLCNRWLYLGSTFQPTTHEPGCVTCQRVLDKEKS